MGLLQALELQEGPIDALTKLDQKQIIALAQQKRIPSDMVSVILNEKALNEQEAANIAAAQKPMSRSVIEQAMAINAQAEAMRNKPRIQPQMMAMAQPQMPPMDVGVASLPIPEDTISMAGGGIVAFEDGGEVQHFQTGDLVRFPSFEDLKPVGSDAVVPGSAISGFLKSLSKDNRRIDPETGEAVTLGEYLRRVDARRVAASKKALPAPIAAPAIPAAAAAAPAIPAAAAVAAPKPKVAEAPKEPELDYTGFRAKYGLDIEDPAMAEIRAKLATMGGESKLDRAHARDMALLQAGLGIMAGTSPYALTNIGTGAMKGTEAYAASIKDIKAAEKDLFKMQAELAKADQARKDGNVKAFMEHQDKAKDYALKLRKANIDENVAQAQIEYYKRPGTYEEMGRAGEKYPWLKERFTAGTENIEMKVRKDAEAYVNNPMLPSQDPTLRDLMKKSKGGDAKATKELEVYKDRLREAYIRRNMPGGQGAAGAGAGGVKFLGYEGQ